jgi:hypothetical protein
VTAIAFVALILALMFLGFANKKHRKETGVNGPTRDGWRRIRRNARKKGISESEAYLQWLNRKSRRTSSAYDFEYFPDSRSPRSNPTPTAGQLSQDAADEPLRAIASAWKWSLRRQVNGLYFILNLEESPSVLIRNPSNPDSQDFTREEIEQFLSPT